MERNLGRLEAQLITNVQFTDKVQAYLPRLPDLAQISADVSDGASEESLPPSKLPSGMYQSNDEHIRRICRRICKKFNENIKDEIQIKIGETEKKLTKSILLLKDKIYEIDELRDRVAKMQIQIGLCALEDDFQSLKDSSD